MKKYIFSILIAVFIPLTSHAKNPPLYMPKDQEQAAITRFANAFCQNGGDVKAFEKAVKNCYQTIPENNIEYQQCFLGDLLLMALYQSPKNTLGISKTLTPDNPDFINMTAFDQRIDHLESLPHSNFIKNERDLAYYFMPSMLSLQKIIKNCNTNY